MSEKHNPNGTDEGHAPLAGVGLSTSFTVYLMNIDNEATVVIAQNIAEAMDKAEKICKKDYEMVYHKSLPLLY